MVKRYGDVVAVDGLELEIRPGDCLGLLGPNGAGKTTTVEILEGLTPFDEGVVRVFGMEWSRSTEAKIRARIGVQLQETQLADKLTVEETLRLFRSFYPNGRSVDEVIAALSLEEKRRVYIGKLSGGQKQRVALGTALVGRPELLFLDEPTTGLDPQARRNVWEVVSRFLEGGGTVCLTTHYMEEAAVLCSRIAVVDHGKVIASGTPEELIGRLEAPELVEIELPQPSDPTARSRLEVDLKRLVHPPGSGTNPTNSVVRGVHLTELGVSVATTSAAHVLPELLRAVEAHQLTLARASIRKATLEDVFLSLTGRGLRDE